MCNFKRSFCFNLKKIVFIEFTFYDKVSTTHMDKFTHDYTPRHVQL